MLILNSLATLSLLAFSFPLQAPSRPNSKTNLLQEVIYTGESNKTEPQLQINIDPQCLCISVVSVTITIKDSDDVIENQITIEKDYPGVITINQSLNDPTKDNETKRTIYINAYFPYNINGVRQLIYFPIYYSAKTEHEVTNMFTHTPDIPYIIKKNHLGELTYIHEIFNFDNLIDLKLANMMINPALINFRYGLENYEKVDLYYKKAELLIDGVFDGSDIEKQNNKYIFPLSLSCENLVCSFAFVNQYYYDEKIKMTYQNSMPGRKMVHSLILPPNSAGKNIYYEIKLEEIGSTYQNYYIRSHMQASLNWFGKCSNSYFCLTKISDSLDSVQYENGKKVSSK